ncbi:ATP-dependent helicase HrpB [Parasedimentitalea huanghaiensis]|uniref:ATP-dependent helicase HrpB n=1 Tax=Parasedimentitalea huanghaiensis TaxID=2682100 RepID=A0A6L6WE17_9RHOB|nr:ATP-dependent helicase HrpB [Zongyanglinia huanghaiensis]MVO16076.1 ATP-dependent helicase HrpB [Zongyanglinia huanghaiensis]
MTKLPIDAVLPELIDALRADGRAVLQAPPGAGKTTRVPLAMLEANLCKGRIVMLEPRRLAARAAAERMAETLGERVGDTVGYRVRGESKVSKTTRIEVVTEGILTRMLQSDPDLPGIGAVIFDEFHERSLNADFGLALCLEVAEALRDDLILMAMSATLDAGPVAELMQAPMVTSEGRSYDVETRWLDRPIATQGPRGPSRGAAARTQRLDALVDLVQQAEKDTRDTGGGILVFLPGEGEIRRAASALTAKLPETCVVRPLFGALPFAEQRAAIAPVKSGRKVVLATSIAETSLTIQDIRVVVDMGQARRARFDPGSGMSRLITEKVTRAEATQRRGRAGRVAEGICYRLWTKGEEGALMAYPPAEIEAADLTGLALELALWGAATNDLSFLTPPPEGAMTEAQALLRMLGALDDHGRITVHGKALATLPLHPRLGHMLVTGGQDAVQLAALMAERDPLRGAPSDLLLRMQAMQDPKGFMRKRPYQVNLPVIERIKAESRRLRQQGTKQPKLDAPLSPAAMAALAYPDRIGQRRKGDTPRYVLSGGKGVVLDDSDTLAAAPFIVTLDSDGNLREARVRMAAQISQSEIRTLFKDQIVWQDICEWSKRDRRVVSRKQERFGAIVLDDQVWKDVPPEAVAEAMLDGVRDLGLRLTGAAARLAARVELVRAEGHGLPDFSIQGLTDTIGDWLLPMLTGIKTAEDWKRFDLLPALRAALDWNQTQLLDREAASHFTSPLGNRIPITYAETGPEIEVRIQELFGVTRHPASGGVPLKITLLSPARRPIQITRDLPGFWTGSYADVRKDMRAQYPRHPWPEDPTQADPTLRAKRRPK